MSSVLVASNIWGGEKRVRLGPGNKFNVADYGPGAEVYVLVEKIGGVVEIQPSTRIFVNVPSSIEVKSNTSSFETKPKRGSRAKNTYTKTPSKSRNISRKTNATDSRTSPNQSGGIGRDKTDSTSQKGFKPIDVYSRAYQKLGDSNFKTVCEGLQELKGLVLTSTSGSIVVQKANTIMPALCRLTTHNNKTVSRTTLTCIADIYQASPSSLQSHLKDVIPALVRKTADKTKMLSSEAENSLTTIISTIDSNSHQEMIVVLLRVTREAKSGVVIEKATHYLRVTVEQIKYNLINDPTTDTPIFDLVKGASQLMSGKEVNTRKEAREIMTLLGQEALSQGSLGNFRKLLERNISSKNQDKVMDIINKIDCNENANYNYFSNNKTSMVATMAAKKASQPRQTEPNKKKYGSTSYGKQGSHAKPKSRGKAKAKVMEGVEAIYTENEDLTISGRPENVLKQAVAALNAGTDNWKRQFEALNEMRYLTLHHHDLIKPQLKDITKTLLGNVGNLRSSIIKNSLMCLQEFFNQFMHLMDKTLHVSVPILVRRSTEKNKFLRKAGEDCCDSMVANCSPLKLIKELMITARQDKDTMMKERAVHFTYGSLEELGESICEEKNRNSLEDVITTIGPLMYNKSPTVRESASNVAKIVVDNVVSTGQIEAFRRIVQLRVEKRWSDKLEITLEKKLGGQSTSKKSTAKKTRKTTKNKSSKKKKDLTSKTSSVGKRKVGKGKKRQKDDDVNRDDILSDMFAQFKMDVADDVTF